MQATTHEYSFFHQHQVMISLVGYYVGSSFVSSLPAPTATSSSFYQFIFKFANTLGANLARAYSSKVETSPNFQAAVVKQNVNEGLVVPVIVTPKQ